MDSDDENEIFYECTDDFLKLDSSENSKLKNENQNKQDEGQLMSDLNQKYKVKHDSVIDSNSEVLKKDSEVSNVHGVLKEDAFPRETPSVSKSGSSDSNMTENDSGKIIDSDESVISQTTSVNGPRTSNPGEDIGFENGDNTHSGAVESKKLDGEAPGDISKEQDSLGAGKRKEGGNLEKGGEGAFSSKGGDINSMEKDKKVVEGDVNSLENDEKVVQGVSGSEDDGKPAENIEKVVEGDVNSLENDEKVVQGVSGSENDRKPAENLEKVVEGDINSSKNDENVVQGACGVADSDDESSEDESSLTEEELNERKLEAKKLKDEGNEFYKNGDSNEAERLYTEAMKICPKRFEKERSVMFSNRSACLVKLEKTELAIADCSKAIELHSTYVKAILRRAQLYEKLEKYEEALKDYERLLEIDPSLHSARSACLRIPGEIEKRNEKLKAQMMSSLKDLGNMFLRPFGLSTNNFQLQQDPGTGSYNIQFNNGPEGGNNNNGPSNGPNNNNT
ncbi:uncharacterized protein LOC120331552 [Styela clava]